MLYAEHEACIDLRYFRVTRDLPKPFPFRSTAFSAAMQYDLERAEKHGRMEE